MASTPLKVTEAKTTAGSLAHVKDPKVQFIFTGFKQDEGVRVFLYEDTGREHVGFRYAVRVDLGLARRYGIQTQELPLMCRGMLERREREELRDVVSFTEEEMSLHASNLRNLRRAALLKKKSRFKPPSVINRIGWRAPQQVLPA